MGIGAIIGAGLFVLTGQAAAENAGPGVLISFILAAVICVFAALCYAEFASLIPISGSAYSYAYVTMGELCRMDHRLGVDGGISLFCCDRLCRVGRAISLVSCRTAGSPSLVFSHSLRWPMILQMDGRYRSLDEPTCDGHHSA